MSANVIIISGPTSSGKTSLAIDVSLFLKNNFGRKSIVINADSIQLYNDLKIITAHPSPDELQEVEHRLFGILNPYDSSSVSNWLQMAKTEIAKAYSDNKIAIICGGTCFYILSLLTGIAEIPKTPPEMRKEISKKFKEIGRDAFFSELCSLDEFSAKNLHKNDTQRILRAYEVIAFTGKPLSVWWNASKNKKAHKYNILGFFALFPEKSAIHSKCNSKILKMMQDGAIKEVRDFIEKHPDYDGSLKKAIGYREILEMLLSSESHEESYEKCIDKMYIHTRQYVKRQSTCMKNQFSTAQFLHGFGNDSDTLKYVHKYLENIIRNML